MNQTIFNASAGALGAFITFAYGEWTELLTFFLIVIAADIATGVSASIKEGRGLSSSVGRVGLANKALMFLAILLAHRIDVLMGTAYVMDGAIWFYVANELLSIVENYGRHGLPLPDGVRRVISVLKDRGAGGGNGDDTK